jgi:hypothetical protein
MENFIFADIFWKLKGGMKTEISRNYEHFQENENLGIFEKSHCNNFGSEQKFCKDNELGKLVC